ncbi:hypothetical protein CERSUDRAFT_110789 [Gelatoporia subvermispora B]|uniref:FAS1 domain-containing protein n=1 Tax=Ceriporiopsis subvermispora (strain B) TaxID=914234 RepID=M2QYL7_CERS8|nr:hypothetical protein CERSUDRAFT_110789 [Gelatoporia subvermispora B]
MHLVSLLLLLFPFFAYASSQKQTVMSAVPETDETYTPLAQPQPTLADLLTIESSLSIYFTYARETELSKLLTDVDARSTILAPTNKAIMALARKPHQGPAPVDEGNVISEEEFDNLSRENVLRWVSAHIIPQSPISLLSSTPYETLLKGTNVTFDQVHDDTSLPDWARVRLNDGVHLAGIKEASNGVIYIMDGTVKVD